MKTTFQSREAVRDELVSLFAAEGSWQAVYGYFPSVSEMSGKTPILIIRSAGTQQVMEGQDTNPATYRFLATTFVLAYSEDGSWTSANAEDKLDELDQAFRQVIRDNAAGGVNADLYRFEPGMSQRDDLILEGVPYILEGRAILADLVNGAVP
jgi:hypothetical protein